MEADTRNILQDIASGDNEAFKTLFNIFFPKVKVFLVKFLKDDKAAEDIAQDIFVRIWSMRQALPEIKSFNTYLYRMTRNAALNYLRDKKVTLEISEISLQDDKDVEQEYRSISRTQLPSVKPRQPS